MSVLRSLAAASMLALTLPGCYIPRGGWTLRSGIDLRTRGKPGCFVEMVDTRWDECNRLSQCQNSQSQPCPPGSYPTQGSPAEFGPQLPPPAPAELGPRPIDPALTHPPVPRPLSPDVPPMVPPAPEVLDNAEAVRMSHRVVVRPQPAPRKVRPRGGWLF